jgi:molecular chaperone GrpE (heat shock protein)
MNYLLQPQNTSIGLLLIFILLLIVMAIVAVQLFSERVSITKAHESFDDLYTKLKEEIRYAVAPKFMELSLGVNELVDLAVEVWRMEQRIGKSAACLPENQLKGLENSIQKLKRYLEKYDIEIIDYKNQKFNEGLNLDILSVEKDPNATTPTVKETVEPTILVKGQVVKKAKIILLSN